MFVLLWTKVLEQAFERLTLVELRGVIRAG